MDRYERRKRVNPPRGSERSRMRYVRPGMPTKYNPETMPIVAKFMCQRGATMSELAQTFQVHEITLYDWINKHKELHDAVQVGVDVFNPRVERALAERALGFWMTISPEEKDEEGNVIVPAHRQYYPPDVTACIFFLKNRMRDKWKDVHRVENELRVLKTSEELRIEVRKDILELQKLGYDPKVIEDKRDDGVV